MRSLIKYVSRCFIFISLYYSVALIVLLILKAMDIQIYSLWNFLSLKLFILFPISISVSIFLGVIYYVCNEKSILSFSINKFLKNFTIIFFLFLILTTSIPLKYGLYEGVESFINWILISILISVLFSFFLSTVIHIIDKRGKEYMKDIIYMFLGFACFFSVIIFFANIFNGKENLIVGYQLTIVTSSFFTIISLLVQFTFRPKKHSKKKYL